MTDTNTAEAAGIDPNDPLVKKALEIFKGQIAQPPLDISSPEALEARAKELREQVDDTIKAENEKLARECYDGGIAALVYGSDEEYRRLLQLRHPGAKALELASDLAFGNGERILAAIQELYSERELLGRLPKDSGGENVFIACGQLHNWLRNDRLSTLLQKRLAMTDDPREFEYRTHKANLERDLYSIELRG